MLNKVHYNNIRMSKPPCSVRTSSFYAAASCAYKFPTTQSQQMLLRYKLINASKLQLIARKHISLFTEWPFELANFLSWRLNKNFTLQ
jgi:hypothetical protein